MMKHQRRHSLLLLWAPRCTCGLRWPCPERFAWPSGTPIQDGSHAWTGPTIAAPQIGRVGHLTPAQAHRANGGRRP